MIDPDKIMEVFEKHADTVTVSFACDLLPLLGMRFAIRDAQGTETPETDPMRRAV